MVCTSKEFDEFNEWNDNGSKEFDEYAEFDKDAYRNFDRVEEYHNDYPEYPDEDKEPVKKPRKEEEPPDLSKHSTHHVSATQVLATTVVALVVVTGIFIPILENKDTSVYIDGSLSNGMIYYMVSIYDYDENTPYYAVLLKGSSIIHQQVIVDGFAEHEEQYDDEHATYAVEVRSGSPPLYVLERKELVDTSGKIWAELEHLEIDVEHVDFGVILHGTDAKATVSIYDSVEQQNLYSQEITEGTFTDTFRSQLVAGRTYYLTVSDEQQTYLMEEAVPKQPTTATIERFTVSPSGADLTVALRGEDGVKATVRIYSPDDKTDIYTKEIEVGQFSDSYQAQLQRGSTFELYVNDENYTYASSEWTITNATLDSITPEIDSIDYSINVVGTGPDLTVTLAGADGATIYTKTVTSSGTISDTISGLEPGDTYVFTVGDIDGTCLYQEVETGQA